MLDFVLIAIFVSFPEAIIIFSLGFSLCNIRNISTKTLLTISAIQALASLLMKTLHVSDSLNTIVLTISLCVLITVFCKLSYFKAIIPALIGSFADGIIQVMLYSFAQLLLNVNLDLLGVDFVKTFIFFIPVVIVSIAILAVIKKTKFTFCNL